MSSQKPAHKRPEPWTTPTVHNPPHPREWSIQEVRDLVQKKLGKRPCWMQLQVAQAIRAGKDVVGCARTGAGKTLSFWIPLLMHIEEGGDAMMFVVTPLNLLGNQNTAILEQGKSGLRSIAVSAKNATQTTFKEIAEGKYQVITINPEILMTNHEVQKMWKNPKVAKRIMYIVFDEGHCISEWAKFREQYTQLGHLRYQNPDIPFYVASATLPDVTMEEITRSLHLRPGSGTEYIFKSNDRPEIGLLVRPMVFRANTFKDLDFLVPDGYSEADGPLPKFLVFFDDTIEAQKAAEYLQDRLPESLRHRITHFHSTHTPHYRETRFKDIQSDGYWGFCCTDAFGMGMDVAGIRIVVQWKVPANLSTLWQRFGRAARGPSESGVGILIVQTGDLHESRVLKAAKAAADRETSTSEASSKDRATAGTKRKREEELTDADQPPPKHVSANPSNPDARRVVLQILEDPLDSDTDDDDDSPVIVEHAAVLDGAGVSASATASHAVADITERRRHYARKTALIPRVKGVRAKKAGIRAEAGSAMDDFINAAAAGFSCRRKVSQIYFRCERDALNDHKLCDTSSPTGCTRCTPRVAAICCDLCHPDAFRHYYVSSSEPPPNAPPKAPGRSRLKPLDMDIHSERVRRLKTDLLSWRLVMSIEEFGEAVVKSYGSMLFISDEIIDRLVHCATVYKIRKHEDVTRETGWVSNRAQAYADSLIPLLHEVYPPPPEMGPSRADNMRVSHPANNSLLGAALESVPDAEPVQAKRKLVTCSLCKQTGHMRNNKNCPVNIKERATRHDKENMPPPPQ